MAAWARATRSEGRTISFVPTMGFLHDGHLSLLREGRLRGDRLVASIYVNPLQFGAGEDLATYPRDPDGDAAKCRDVGCDVLFQPSDATMYPPGFQTRLVAGALAQPLCGETRPGHFDGVVTVVLKLFNLVKPHVAVFGRKDFQQFAVLRRMVRDLDVDVEMLGMPIIRESDGLAMSSRNAYLTPEERSQALALSRSLEDARDAFARGERSPAVLQARIREGIEGRSLATIDYCEVLDAEDLTPSPEAIDREAVAAVAVFFGRTRLIDNVVLSP